MLCGTGCGADYRPAFEGRLDLCFMQLESADSVSLGSRSEAAFEIVSRLHNL